MSTWMAVPTVAGMVCDHSECPAPALRTFIVHGQDFHFCNHHAVELIGSLAAAHPRRAEGPGTGDRAAVDVPPAGGRAAMALGRGRD